MNRILVPVNLRSNFDNILNYATSVGRKSGAEITLFYYGGRRLFKGNGQLEYSSDQPANDLLQRVKGKRHKASLGSIINGLSAEGIQFRLKAVKRRSYSEIIRECDQQSYDLVIMGTDTSTRLGQMLGSSLANRVMGAINAPTFVVPSTSGFNDIQHITYAVDLSDYDPSIVQQVKAIAKLFDAKLSITHVNVETEPQHKEQYLNSLQQTISDTIDYPKVYYKFFDHADPLGGLVKFVDMNNSNLVAMITRKKFSWRDIFGEKSFTRKISQKLSVPVLAFRK